MKIQCDVCEKEEASIFCTADEAALCKRCDQRVHHANKLASKHLRFSLLHPSSKDSPLCDICQERRALLFCQEDRAILCRECDIPIHKANEHTQKHNRYLLTGVKLSACAPSSSHQTSACSRASSSVGTETENKSSVCSEILGPNSTEQNTPQLTSTAFKSEYNYESQDGASVATSSISEYLMETLPGWHVEDLLDPSYGFCKAYNHMLPYADYDLESTLGSVQSHNLAVRVLQPCSYNFHQTGEWNNGVIKGSEELDSMTKCSRRLSEDGCIVPQISPPSTTMSTQYR
ncbi:hypothetical protein RJ640_017123 [Escallonia rubra]|uniref:B box-type domain-containing protein n=1 Tax=Escallonia rubra TaxID=112253 RepID=A0AA88UK56_9ASTE|nr:hypothetical protein RJ640_017123 [Escallonia rubra]